MRLPSGETLGAPTALSLSCISGSHVCAMAAEAKRTTRVRAVATYFMIFLLIWITDGALSFYSRLPGKSTNLGRNSSLQNSGWNSSIHRLHRFIKGRVFPRKGAKTQRKTQRRVFILASSVRLCARLPYRNTMNLCNLWIELLGGCEIDLVISNSGCAACNRQLSDSHAADTHERSFD